MSDKYQNKYRISSSRLKNWNYGSYAMYFVTICTKNRQCYFGEIDVVEAPESGASKIRMELSDIGKIVNHFWNEIPNHFPFVELGEFVVMPNHVHGIIIIDKPLLEAPDSGASTTTLGVIINQFKRIVTINARKIQTDFFWQSRFYDHIIRNDQSFENISNYIINNPTKWQHDKFR